MRKSHLVYYVTTLDEQIQAIHKREMNACYASARGENHEDMNALMIQRWNLEDQRTAVLRRINKPSLIKRLGKVVRK